MEKILKLIRSKIDRYKLNKKIKDIAKDTDVFLTSMYNKKFKYLGTNHIMCSTLITVNLDSIILYRNLFKKLSNQPTLKDYKDISAYAMNININKFLTNHREDPIKVYKETIEYYREFNYKFIEYEQSKPNDEIVNFLSHTRKLRFDFISILKEIDKIEI